MSARRARPTVAQLKALEATVAELREENDRLRQIGARVDSLESHCLRIEEEGKSNQAEVSRYSKVGSAMVELLREGLMECHTLASLRQRVSRALHAWEPTAALYNKGERWWEAALR